MVAVRESGESSLAALAALVASAHGGARKAAEHPGGVAVSVGDRAILRAWARGRVRADAVEDERTHLAARIASLRQQVAMLESERTQLSEQLADLEAEDGLRARGINEPARILGGSSADVSANTLRLGLKAREYRSRKATHRAAIGDFNEAKAGHAALVDKRYELDKVLAEQISLQSRLAFFHDLDPDAAAATQQLCDARSRLASLNEQFERLVNGMPLA